MAEYLVTEILSARVYPANSLDSCANVCIREKKQNFILGGAFKLDG